MTLNAILTPGDKVEELERLLRTGLVRDGSQGYALLEYIGRRAIEERGEPLKEYTIGVEALGKPADYDPRIDPTVRVEIGRLRARLKNHYAEEAAGRKVRLEIPKGGYAAEFVANSHTAPADESAPVPARPRRLWWAAGLLAAGVAAGVLVPAFTSKPRLTPALAHFWAPHLRGGLPTLLVYGAPLFIKVDGAYFRDPHVNSPAEVPEDPGLNRLLAALKPSEQRPVYHFTGFGEAEAIFRITRLMASAGAQIGIRRSNDVSWDELKREHVILLGGSKFNRQIADLPHRFKYESVARRILNRHPAPGETAEYVTRSATPHGPIAEEYALISVYPGLGPGSRLMVLDSSSSEGTGMAAEFLTREDTVRTLHGKLGRGTAQPFQMVVKGRFKDGILIAVDYVSHAVL